MSLLGAKASEKPHAKELALFEKWMHLRRQAYQAQPKGGTRYHTLVNRMDATQYELQDMSPFGHSLVWGHEGRARGRG